MVATLAIILCSPLVRLYLINYARPLIYTTFMSFPSLACIRASYSLLQSGQTEHVRPPPFLICLPKLQGTNRSPPPTLALPNPPLPNHPPAFPPPLLPCSVLLSDLTNPHPRPLPSLSYLSSLHSQAAETCQILSRARACRAGTGAPYHT